MANDLSDRGADYRRRNSVSNSVKLPRLIRNWTNRLEVNEDDLLKAVADDMTVVQVTAHPGQA